MFKPTFLFLKQHTVTGKLYFGKTSCNNPITYNGSGIHWKRHIRLHGEEHVETLWFCLFVNNEECVKFAVMYSGLQNIVNSEDYLNLKIENGLDGGSWLHTAETKQKLSDLRQGKSLSSTTKQKLSIAAKGKTRPISMYTDQWRDKQRASHLGRSDTLETFNRKSLAQSGSNNPRAKIWKLLSENGTSFEVKGLIPWCKDHGIIPGTLRANSKKNLFHKGFKLII